MNKAMSQFEKAQQFHRLHHSEDLLVLPNIWDSLGARLLESIGYPAIATASASIAFTNGYQDGEKIPFDDLLVILEKIVAKVDIPVTADIESGFANNHEQLKQNLQRVIGTGVVGINFEDTNKETNTLYPIEQQCERISLVKQVAGEMNIPLFINARTDVYVRSRDLITPEAKLEETLKRANAYKSVGADCFFPLAIQRKSDIRAIVQQLQMPVNIILIPGVPEINTLHDIGVKRISLGPGFLKIAIQAMKKLAVQLQHHDGLKDITGNEITSDYLINLLK